MPKVDLLAMANSVGKSTTARSKDPKDTPEEREQRTIREMAIMRLLRHPNICQLKEYISEGDKYYMFLEYVDGGQLLDYIIKHGKLREKLARKFARQIVSALGNYEMRAYRQQQHTLTFLYQITVTEILLFIVVCDTIKT